MQVTSSTTAGSPGNAASSISGPSNTLTADMNTFLKLFVTELQNQDPTANTDPNAYINQLVGINSLEQLISINQDLAPLSTGGTGTSG
nr:flagellar hook capping FlgD N-terminal domain-containing protein [Burkholderiales bacterium]